MPLPMGDGLDLDGKTYYKVAGANADGLCAFTYQSRGGTIFASPEVKARVLAAGTTEDQLNTILETMNASINNPESLAIVSVCSGANADVATYLTNLKSGISKSSCSTSLGSGGTTCTVEPNITCTMK